MSKITLGKRPTSFRTPVKFPLLDGTTGVIQWDFKYRTRKEFGAFIDSVVADARKAGDDTAAASVASSPAAFSMADLMASTNESNAKYILEAANGWDLPDAFTLDNIEQLNDEVPGAIVAAMEAYRAAITEGRLGN
jgi:hypothetical protein